MEKVVAIILNYNTSNDCEKCVSYLAKQDYDELSIVIVDNASPNCDEKDNLVKISHKYKCDLIFADMNNGFSAGNNIGLRFVSEKKVDWAIIINPDVELRDIHYISYVMEEKKKWARVAVIGTNVVLPTGERQNPQRESTYWESVLWPLEILKSKIDKKKNRYLCEDKTGYCEKVTGACFFISVPFVKSIGYLDENVFMYSEEAILAAQVRLHKGKILYISEAVANHEHYGAKKAPSKERMLLLVSSRLYYYQNYGQMNKAAFNIVKLSLIIEKKLLERRRK